MESEFPLDIGGKSALDYLIHVEGLGFVEAVRTLCGEQPSVRLPTFVEEQKKEFHLPVPAANCRRVFAYLQGRGIAPRVIASCIKMGILYESEGNHNAVFVGRDEEGAARYAFLRGTYSRTEKPFRGEVTGSEKAFCFCIPAQGKTNRVAVYEAAIDALAHWTLEGTQDKHRLSLGGIYAPKSGTAGFQNPRALDAFLARHPEVDEIEVCTDNDPAGRFAAACIIRAYGQKYRMIDHPPDVEQGDYADLARKKQRDREARAASR